MTGDVAITPVARERSRSRQNRLLEERLIIFRLKVNLDKRQKNRDDKRTVEKSHQTEHGKAAEDREDEGERWF